MKFKVFLVVIFLIACLSVELSAEQKIFTGGIDPTIWRVVEGGFWQDGKFYGHYRVVVQNLGWEQTRSYLFLQWLKNDDEKGEVVELKTIPIPEFNENNWFNVVDVQYGKDAFIIFYMVRGEEDKVRKAELRPHTPGQYIFVFQ